MLYETKEQIEFEYQSSIDFAAKKAADKAAAKARQEASEHLEAKTEKAVRNMILEGLSTKLICKIQEVTPDYVAKIREAIKNEASSNQ